MTRDERMATRREAKFKKCGIEIKDEKHRDIRNGEPVDFNYAVVMKDRLVGRTHTRRSALKRAHQTARSLNG